MRLNCLFVKLQFKFKHYVRKYIYYVYYCISILFRVLIFNPIIMYMYHDKKVLHIASEGEGVYQLRVQISNYTYILIKFEF